MSNLQDKSNKSTGDQTSVVERDSQGRVVRVTEPCAPTTITFFQYDPATLPENLLPDPDGLNQSGS